ncbi:ABC transporter ATP-binding protein [Cellulosimicrobium sp. Marseille-Q4280]|uniref:ABC transporter ATP-binding protein n=1 Tax=Cellulosimicrobium sp. Marseille-Q4280 TaxID=2937992 RepID=UPI002041DAC2|nr:ABC transporter ATP-binding protein [Cellulosimicrobium sp. Marseille-Q4280]
MTTRTGPEAAELAARSGTGPDERSSARVPGAVAEPDILCQDLVRIFSADGVEVQALQGLNLRVDPGELVAIVGASGSGKSTLLTILSGLDRPTGGSAVVAGTDLLTMGRRERVRYQRHTVGFVWQQTSRNLLPYLSAAENVAVPLALAGDLGARERRARVDALLELLEVGHVRDRRPDQMSGGEQQRTALAVAVANAPRVLLADEPTGELDEATSVEVLEAMRGVNAELGVTTLIVTHDPTVSDHVLRTVQIRDGRTSTEVLRRTEVDEHGSERHVAEEFAVLDRVGRLQLPPDFVASLDLRDRVRLALETDHVGVWPDGRGRPVTDDDGTRDDRGATPPREEGER